MLASQMTSWGAFLFRWRGYLPLLLLPLVAVGISQFRYPFGSHALDVAWEMACLAVAAAGEAVRIAAVGFAPKGTSGRNTRRIKADALNTTGMYSIVRHPLYLGNFLIFASFLLFVGPWWLVVIGSLIYWLYYERIMLAEEAFLRQRHGERFVQWAAQTPAVWPRIRRWRRPELPFSLRSVIRREYTTIFLILGVFTAIEVAGDLVVHRHLEFEPLWRILFFTALAFYLAVRILKKWTGLLEAPGR
ncbi:MAG TPA: isoprenylcysteine carboxylmethyltransferase family protein [Phycisphaeraceae bacterium]